MTASGGIWSSACSWLFGPMPPTVEPAEAMADRLIGGLSHCAVLYGPDLGGFCHAQDFKGLDLRWDIGDADAAARHPGLRSPDHPTRTLVPLT